jgi:hypothetical protein
MKDIRRILTIGLFAISLLGFESGCLAADENLLIVNENGTSIVNASALNLSIGQITLGNLSVMEKDGLLYMVEEEKLAGDVYQTLGNLWNQQVFSNIGEAEKTHQAAVMVLINRYGLTDPTIKEVGKFSNATLQKTYDELTSKGKTSLKDAMDVGAEIEEIDILDLQKQIAETDKADIKIVYENLMRGSGNHLRAFVSNLNRHGYEYTPMYLGPEQYDSIMNNKG